MGHRAWRGWPLALSILGSVSEVSAQTATARAVLLPPVPELRLKWPIAPLAYRYTESEIGGYRNGPLQLFRAESLWVRVPGLQLLSYASSERAFELDCSVTCQPVAVRGFGVEARLALPNVLPLVSEPHVFVRQSSARSPLQTRAVGALNVGLGGFLNF